MKNPLFYIPAILFTFFYGVLALSGVGPISPVVVVWLVLWFISGFILNKGYFWGSLPGALPAIHLIYMGTRETGQIIKETPIGVVILIYYVICGYWVYRKKQR
ncbi:hypothetical protein DFR58_10741 [Anaerobacterium chartisolvens]|uniref:Uncharacterized protein n=1 Tax=Anaerobacterium chartisolvens TaxID=1297424 RepID=A0A369BA74_9FIRM|nr:hypothetical protein [Anaerobacterium chartisolvens]RCX17498.1 hypothetical protein DFR58_10741 [Anaerobacterium chartisolvens]